MSASRDPYIKVLLVEEEQDAISFLSLLLSEVKECKLFVAPSQNEALSLTAQIKPDLILLAHDLRSQENFSLLSAMHKRHPSVYLIVSLPEGQKDLTPEYMKAGAVDCILKDSKYIQNLVYAVKKALIRVAERESFSTVPLSYTNQYILDENVPDIVFILDMDGRLIHVNPAITKMLQYDPKELTQASFAGIVSEESRPLFENYVHSILEVPKFRGMLPLINKSGDVTPFEVNCALVESSLVYGVARAYGTLDREAAAVEEGFPEEAQTTVDSIPSHLGPYRVVTLLGAGSMGRVYKGYDEPLDRNVAIKVINKSLADDSKYMESFHREARLLAKMTHPNIALIYYFGNLEGMPFFCMEYLPGGSLESTLQEKEKLDPETAVSYALQVAVGLKEALRKGVIHLDIKPSNLMIADNNRIKIVDFGLARRSLETDQAVAGTPFYIAPEQFRGSVPDHRCDIYSLGITLFRMLYGRFPFAGKTMAEVVNQQTQQSLPSRELLDPSVPASLHEIIERMTCNDPDKRFDDYNELIQELELARRGAGAEPEVADLEPPPSDRVTLRGLLFDQPFPEIIGEILRRHLSGKLTLSWMNLCKTIHVKDGKAIAVLSNQEGERFVDLLLEKNHLSGKKAHRLESGSFDLMASYDSLVHELSPGAGDQLKGEIAALSWKILQGLFPWVMGEFLFEEGDFRGQRSLEIHLPEILLRGIKEWQDITMTRQRLLQGRCLILMEPDFEERLKLIPLRAADSFLLFRFEKSISFQELFLLAGIPEEEFLRLIYLFRCVGIIRTTALDQKKNVKPVQPLPSRSVKSDPVPVKQPAPEKQTAPPSGEENKPGVRFRSQEDGAAYYIRLAGQSFRSKNYYATVEYCRKALEQKKEAGTYELMGDAFATHPKFRLEAMEAYKKALELNPRKVQVHRSIADLYFSTGNYALARSKYQEFLKLVPDDAHTLERLSEISKR